MTSLEVCGAGLKHAGWQDYAFAVYTQPLGSSWMVFARKQILASLEMTRVWVCGSLPRHLTPCHSEEPKRRGICCSPTFGQTDISRCARNDNAWGFFSRVVPVNSLHIF